MQFIIAITKMDREEFFIGPFDSLDEALNFGHTLPDEHIEQFQYIEILSPTTIKE